MAIEKSKNMGGSSGKTILALVLLIVVVVGLFMFVLPTREEFKENKVSLAQKETEVKSLKSKLSQIESLEKSFEGTEVTLMDTLNMIPENPEQEKIINALATFADDNEVSMNALSFGFGNATDVDVRTITITTNIAGTHKSLLDFLEDLEQDSRKYIVKTISVQKLQNVLENMSISIEAYYL